MEFLETIKAQDGRLFHLEYHQQRLQRALASIGCKRIFPLADLLCPPRDGLFRCRVLYDEESLTTEYIPYTPRIVHTLQAVIDDSIEYPHKYANRDRLDTLYTQRGSCDDVLIVKDGLLTDTTIANIALFDGKQWFTPETPLLLGTTRARLLEEGRLTPMRISLDMLPHFKATAIMNAMLGFVQVKDGIIRPKLP